MCPDISDFKATPLKSVEPDSDKYLKMFCVGFWGGFLHFLSAIFPPEESVVRWQRERNTLQLQKERKSKNRLNNFKLFKAQCGTFQGIYWHKMN